MSAVTVRWLILLLAWSQCGGRRLPGPGPARLARSSRDADRPAPCRSAVCRWEAFRERTVPGEPRPWPAAASLTLAQLRLTAGPRSERLLLHCRRLALVCVHPLCPCEQAAALGDSPNHDDMCDMLCGIGEGGSECECMKPPAAAGPETAR